MTDQPSPLDRFSNLSTIDKGIAEIAIRPQWPVYLATSVAVILAWAWLSFIAAGTVQGDTANVLGPGMGLIQGLFSGFQVNPADQPLLAFILKICAPFSPSGFGWPIFLGMVGMWFAMSLAMMLPSAAPLIRTYADIADVASQKGEKVIPLRYLLAGYLSVWTLFCVVISTIQAILMQVGAIADPVYPVQGIIGGLLLLLAGGYQFSSLKNACLEKCRNPFSYLFGKWSQEHLGVFKLGIEQGLFCLGCCWALMLVMLVVGTMNLAWMAFFTLFVIIEKSGKGKVTSHVSGGILLSWGGLLLIASIASA